MGTWGTGVFADDDAADVRSDFEHYVADTQDIAQATNAIALDYGAAFDIPQEHTAFWLGLALTQWRKGWLDPRVLTTAIHIIDDGLDLAKWRNGNEATKRARELKKVRAQLQAPPPSPRPFPKPWPIQLPDFQVGEIVARRLPGNRTAVMKVVGFRRTTALKVAGPAVRLQKWVSVALPTPAEAEKLEYLRWPIAPNKVQTFRLLVLTGARRAPLDPDLFIRPGIVVPLQQNEDKGGYTSVSTWGPYQLDDILASGVARWWEDPGLSATALPPWCSKSEGNAGN